MPPDLPERMAQPIDEPAEELGTFECDDSECCRSEYDVDFVQPSSPAANSAAH